MAREKGMGNLQREKSGRWTMRVSINGVHYSRSTRTKDAERTQETQDGKGMGGGEKEAEIGGEDGEEIDHAEHGDDIIHGTGMGVDTQIVFQCEKESKAPFQQFHHYPHPQGPLPDDGETIDNHQQNVQHDGDQQPDIETLSSGGIRLEDNDIYLVSVQAVF